MKLDEIQKKSKITKKIKYNNENYVNVEKAKKTKKNKYGDANYNNREKSKATCLEKYGVPNFTNREKSKETSLMRYGNPYYNNREKQFRTNIIKYGVKIYNNREKSKKTCLERYGAISYNKSEEYKIKKYENSIKNWATKLKINVNQIKYDGDILTIYNLCKKHNAFTINRYQLRNRLNYHVDNICTLCNPIADNTSIKENEIREYIENELHLKTEKIKINNKEIDIYLPDYKLGIEFDGLYWHSHINIADDYHVNKTNDCEKNAITLLHIFENEWINKKEIVKSIIKSKLGIFDNKIFARKCEVKEIQNNVLIRNFIENNHIQGFVGSKIKVGLFYNDELVSIMTFGKKRIAMGNKSPVDNEYEMLRFCNKLNTQVIGGASKLLNFFIKTYNPKSILTYADRRYSQGNLYEQLGFKFIENTKPNYWYFKNHEYKLYHRFRFRKDVLIKEGFDASKTELQIMEERNYLRIYDSGNKKYVLKLR
jgi:hypothetical protein